jgi:LysR family transcriptional regulator, transcriptional activator of the cysJI operon
MFDFRLQVFHTVATRLNFTRAAEELYISQPAVTKHIHEIEHHFKLKLFERNGTKIRLTAAGSTLLQYTSKLFELYGHLEFDMNSLAEKHRGKLRLGASTTVAQYVLPPVLAAFHRKFEEIKASLAVDNTVQTEQALADASIDLGIVEGRSKSSSFRYTEFIKDKLVLVGRAAHPLAKQAVLKPQELLSIPMLLREPGSGTLEVIAHALKPLGIKLSQLRREMQLESTESIKSYLANADCLAFLSLHSIRKELADKDLVVMNVKGLDIERNFYFIQQQGEVFPLAALFMKFALRYNFR